MTIARAKSKTVFGVPVPVACFLFAMMLPTAVSLNLGGLRLSAYRLVLLVMFLPMLFQLLANQRGRLHIFDALLLTHCFWALLALIKWGGFAQGLESGGIYVIECAGAYLMGRLYIRSYQDFAAMARAYVGLVLATLVFTVPEALTGIHILHDSLASAFGGPKAAYIEPRMGIERTFGPFDHPILYGVFCASAFSLAYFVIAERKLTKFSNVSKVVGVGLATFMSASGGPYVVLMAQIFVCAWERVLGTVQGRWAALFSFFAIAYLAIDLLSNRTPFHVFVEYLTFSKQSAYNRIIIFEYGTAEVARNPLFGIGLGDWIRPVWMSESMDNFWLVTAVRYGLPAFFLQVGLLLGMVWAVGQRPNFPPAWRRARHAWAFTLFGISVAAATVHLWNALFVLFFFLIGTGAWMLDAQPSRQKRKTRRPVPIATCRPARLF
ncbi:hypothetical protein [Shimia abyssi]|uniref:O-antigen ligase-like membrane protein n=1 Tax=Shimia abyssi TaxID=1662395 RepID=A0A2P8FJT2_9RHOB|nr:hypothetical protein [Shimia abyssi]PSL21971.1 hypothetical protein CLV88_101396 [Shimia abyssi]